MKGRLFSYSCLLTTSLIWGFGGPILKYTLGYLPPFNFLFWRFFLTSLLALPIFIWYLSRNPIKIEWLPKILLLGFLVTTINLSFVISGFAKTTAIEGTLLTSLSPLFVVLGGITLLKEKITRRAQVGIALAIIGAIVAVIGPLVQAADISANPKSFTGNILILCGGLVWMTFVLLSKRWVTSGIKPFHIASISFFVGAVTFFPLAIIEKSQVPSLAQFPQEAILGIIYMAIFSSLIAYTAYETGLSKIQASEADIFNYLHVVWATPLAILWLGEKLTPTFILGVLLIVSGLVLAEYRPGLLRGHHLAHNK